MRVQDSPGLAAAFQANLAAASAIVQDAPVFVGP
jgi:hypothetical protein